MKKIIFSLSALTLLIASCNSEKSEETNVEKAKVENCFYTYSAADSKLDWTAFKFLRKAPVGGTFTQIIVNGSEPTSDAVSLMEKLSFTIPVNTVETNNESRNKKIDSIFFGSLSATETIKGEVLDLDDDGNATLKIEMNEISNEVEGAYTLVDGKFTFATEIDLLDWSAQAGLDNLNEACKELHTDIENGDKESKLWSIVDIIFTTQLAKKCE